MEACIAKCSNSDLCYTIVISIYLSLNRYLFLQFYCKVFSVSLLYFFLLISKDLMFLNLQITVLYPCDYRDPLKLIFLLRSEPEIYHNQKEIRPEFRCTPTCDTVYGHAYFHFFYFWIKIIES